MSSVHSRSSSDATAKDRKPGGKERELLPTELEDSDTFLITTHWPLLKANSDPTPWSTQPQRALPNPSVLCEQCGQKRLAGRIPGRAIPGSHSLGPSPERPCESQRLGERTLKNGRTEGKRGDHAERDRAEGKTER